MPGHQCAQRAENLCEAGEYYAMVGEYELAERAFREALDIDEAEPGRPQAGYAAFLFDRGRADEAFAQITAARRLRPEDLDVFNAIGEALEAHGHLQQAARWFVAGLAQGLEQLADLSLDDLRTDPELGMLANGRFRVRQALDLPLDHIDELVLAYRR
ncbi:hypothetical protein [Dactylosporangium sp. CS-033363]|uniref:hypothetical protein n=1 Tax=Dactylosporangium sp. CS-033363 TaxID=3239935 RepID=UPI003D89DA95